MFLFGPLKTIPACLCPLSEFFIPFNFPLCFFLPSLLCTAVIYLFALLCVIWPDAGYGGL